MKWPVSSVCMNSRWNLFCISYVVLSQQEPLTDIRCTQSPFISDYSDSVSAADNEWQNEMQCHSLSLSLSLSHPSVAISSVCTVCLHVLMHLSSIVCTITQLLCPGELRESVLFSLGFLLLLVLEALTPVTSFLSFIVHLLIPVLTLLEYLIVGYANGIIIFFYYCFLISLSLFNC